MPGPRPPGPGHGPQDQQGWAPPPHGPAGKSTIGTLLDPNFDHMITAKLAKVIYLLSLVPITIVALTMAWYGFEYQRQDMATVGFILLVSSPCVWLLQVLMVRVGLEFVVNQFKISEYLRAIKDKK